jgi:hypothetical protein
MGASEMFDARRRHGPTRRAPFDEAAGRANEAEQDPDHRRLARAVRADEAGDFCLA